MFSVHKGCYVRPNSAGQIQQSITCKAHAKDFHLFVLVLSDNLGSGNIFSLRLLTSFATPPILPSGDLNDPSLDQLSIFRYPKLTTIFLSYQIDIIGSHADLRSRTHN